MTKKNNKQPDKKIKKETLELIQKLKATLLIMEKKVSQRRGKRNLSYAGTDKLLKGVLDIFVNITRINDSLALKKKETNKK